MTKCTTCGEELEYDAKFCTTCGAKVNNKVDIISNNKVAETTKSITSFVKSIGVFLVLLFVGFFVYTIFKVMFSLVFMVLINFNIVELTTYRSIKVLFVLVSIFLAIIYTPKINNLKTIKAKIILGILIVILGTIGAVWISTSNIMARSVQTNLPLTSLNKSTSNSNMILQECKKNEVFDITKNTKSEFSLFSEIKIYDKNKVLIYLDHGVKPDFEFHYTHTVGEGTQFNTDTYKSGNYMLSSWYEKHYDTRSISIRLYDDNANIIKDTTFKDCKPIKH